MARFENSHSDTAGFGHRWDTPDATIKSFEAELYEAKDLPRMSDERPFEVKEHATKSAFKALPLELIHDIFEYLDLRSLLDLRLCSSALFELVNRYSPLRELVEYAPRPLRFLARIHVINQHSVLALHQVLRNDRCSYCSDYGQYLHVVNCTRCCFNCATKNERLSLISNTAAKRVLGLKFSDLSSSLSIWSLGGYNPRLELREPRQFLWNKADAISLAKSLGKDVTAEDLSDQVDKTQRDVVPAYRHAVVAFPYVDHQSPGGVVQHGLRCGGCLEKYRLNKYLNEQGPAFPENWHEFSRLQKARRKVLEEEKSCSYRAYSTAEFAEHIKLCPEVKKLRIHNYPNLESLPPVTTGTRIYS